MNKLELQLKKLYNDKGYMVFNHKVEPIRIDKIVVDDKIQAVFKKEPRYLEVFYAAYILNKNLFDITKAPTILKEILENMPHLNEKQINFLVQYGVTAKEMNNWYNWFKNNPQ